MIRPALVLVAASRPRRGCAGGGSHDAQPPPPPPPPPPPKPQRQPAGASAEGGRPRRHVAVIDGDTHAASGRRPSRSQDRKRPGSHAARSASSTCRARSAPVTAMRRRATPSRTVRLGFDKRPRSDALRLPPRAAVADVRRRRRRGRRRSRRSGCGRRSAIVWSRGLGLADRVSGRRLRRRRVHRQRARHRPARLDGRRARSLWRRDTRDGKMAASPAVLGDRLVVARRWTAHVFVLHRYDGRVISAHTRSARRSSPRRSCATASTTSAPGTGRSTPSTCGRRHAGGRTRSGCKITSSAALAGGTVLHRRLLRPAARA